MQVFVSCALSITTPHVDELKEFAENNVIAKHNDAHVQRGLICVARFLLS